METINKGVAKVTGNPIGAIAGGIVLFWAAKKYANVSKTWQLAGVAVIGVLVGATVQGMVKAKMSTPKATLAAK